jgi:hypothetical protein
MSAILLSLLLALQLTFTNLTTVPPAAPDVQPRQLWWGMIDPELSAWFARCPDADKSETQPILWNWSFRSIWAALTSQPIVKEAADAPRL